MKGKPESQKHAMRRHHAQRRKAWVRRTLRHYFMDRQALYPTRAPSMCPSVVSLSAMSSGPNGSGSNDSGPNGSGTLPFNVPQDC